VEAVSKGSSFAQFCWVVKGTSSRVAALWESGPTMGSCHYEFVWDAISCEDMSPEQVNNMECIIPDFSSGRVYTYVRPIHNFPGCVAQTWPS
jgi:hypothetical protein